MCILSWKDVTLFAFLLFLYFYSLGIQQVEGKNIKRKFLFRTLAISKHKLDASYYFEYDNLEWDGKIIAIGDLHGDIESLRLILIYANVIDENDTWISEKVLLIQVGDILDKGIYGPFIYDFLFDLQKQAEKKKSKIFLIMGNHEQKNLCGVFNHVITDEIKVIFQNDYEKRSYSFSNKNGYYYKRLIRMPSIIKVNNIIFTHGGISKKYSQLSIDLINIKTRLQIENKCNIVNYDSYDYLSSNSVLLYKEMSNKVKLNQLKSKVCNVLSQNLKRMNAKYLVVGHTKQTCHKISAFCNNSYFLIDTSMSSFINNGQSFPNYLEIENGKFVSYHLVIENENNKKQIKRCDREVFLTNPQKKKVCVYAQITLF